MTETAGPKPEEALAPRLAALLALNHTLYTDRDMDMLLHKLLRLVTESLDAEAASLALIDAEARELVFQVAVGDTGDRVEQFRLPIGTGIAGWVAANRQIVRIDDARQDDRFLSRIDDVTGFETRNLLCLPLEHGGRVLGVLEALNKRGGPFTVADECLCHVLTNTVAIALENFQLHRQQRLHLGDGTTLSADDQKLMAVQELLNSGSDVAGFLTVHRPPALLRGLADAHRGGTLHLSTDADTGEIALDHGEIVNAWVPRRRLVGSAAVLEMLGWQSGLFRFDPIPSGESARTRTEPLWLLLARGRERATTLQRLIEAMPLDRPLHARAPLPADEVAGSFRDLLPATVPALLAGATADRLAVAETLSRWLADGHLTVTTGT